MQVILLEDIRNLGKIGEVVNVRDGYGRNFLLKFGKALRADKANIDFVKRKDFSRITLTLKCINRSKSIFLWSPNRKKSNIVEMILLDKKFKYPASFLKKKNNFLFHCN